MFYDIYAQTSVTETYRQTGKGPDGAVLFKRGGSHSSKMRAGNANWSGDTQVCVIMIKDVKGRFPNNPLWGNGWRWALFKAYNPAKRMATKYKNECLNCNTQARSNNWVYVDGCPTPK